MLGQVDCSCAVALMLHTADKGSCKRPSFTPLQNNRKYWSFVYIILTFFEDSRWEDKRF
jgi:hypothetical protein